MMQSLKWRLVAGFVVGLTLILAFASVVIYLEIGERLYAEFDRGLHQRAETLVSMAEEEDGEITTEWIENGKDRPPGHQEGHDFYELLDAESGEAYLVSENLMGGRLPRAAGSGEGAVYPVPLPGGRTGRCITLRFRPMVERDGKLIALKAGRELIFLVAKRDRVLGSLYRLRNMLVILWLLATLVGGAGIWWLVGSNVRPLGELQAQIGDLEDTVSGKRIELRKQPSELVPVTRELNRLLERVEGALLRERNLTSNVAHELRTPISGLLSNLEVTLSRERSVEDYRESGAECFEIAKRLHWLVTNLLSLTRLEEGRVRLQMRAVDLTDALDEWWQPFAERARARNLRVSWKMAPGVRVETDPEMLRVVVSNLCDNAVSYTPEGGEIGITVDEAGRLVVGNDTVGALKDDPRRFFEPFWRGSENREGGGSHVGLGLSLCQKIMDLLGGRIEARVEEGGQWFEARVEWPA